jgi:hypothetical protein
MKPTGILLFFVSVFTLLFAGALYFPEEGIRISDNFRLQFFSRKEIISPDQDPYANISSILKHQHFITDSVLLAIAEGKTEALKIPGANTDSLISSITPVEYPGHDTTLLYPFFRSLRNLSSSRQLVRVLHYGDSQIEDDRMTSLLRNKLQTRFGGSGAGLVPASQLYPYGFSMKQTSSKNWSRFTGFGKRDPTINHNRYGVLASYCTFNYRNKSSTGDTSVAWVRFRASPYSYNNTRRFYQCRIFYGQNRAPFLNELFENNKLVDADILPASNRLRVIRWKLDGPVSDLKLTFKGQSSPEIYGIALDGQHGVAVDNIPLRGCSGLFFTRMDEPLMKDMFRELNVKCFILQFGGNFVPAGLNSFSGYENWFGNQIRQLKKLCPGASVLVIGVADMSVRDKDRYVTDPNVEKVRNALRSAAFKSGAAFWDMYRAMGGRNSMPSWVFANPPLASGDFVHFNPHGAKTIAQMFYDALILEYLRYEKNSP